MLRRLDAVRPAPDEVLIAADWSSINYKDALAVTGAPGILRSAPMTPGVDVVGSADGFAGAVIATGAGLGERRDGGLAEQVVAPRDAVVAVPGPFTPRQAAAIGTAGFTAALCVLALERHGIPAGPVLVSGAGGGVGGFAVALLAAHGRAVVAATGRSDKLGDHLRALGAAEVVPRLPVDVGRSMQSVRWAGVVDTVGAGPLVNAIAQTRLGGAVAACGLAAGDDLPGSVMPFILRGVALLGVQSVTVARADRLAAWDLLRDDLAPALVDRMTERVVPLVEVPVAARDVLGGRVRGRIVVDLRA